MTVVIRRKPPLPPIVLASYQISGSPADIYFWLKLIGAVKG